MNKNVKYSYDDRKHIVQLIENLKNNEDYNEIFEILMNDKNLMNDDSYTSNSNGVFLNLSVVTDETLNQIIKYLNKVNKRKKNHIDVDVDVIPNVNLAKNDRAYKLSNYEKNILKQRKIKKALNQDDEYEELKLFAKKGTKKRVVKKKLI